MGIMKGNLIQQNYSAQSISPKYGTMVEVGSALKNVP